MISKKIYLVLGENNDLGNKIHSYYIYKADKDVQTRTIKVIDGIIDDYTDSKLLSLSYDTTTRRLMKELIALKHEPNWNKIVMKILRGLKGLLLREIELSKPIRKPKDIRNYIKKELKKLDIYHKTDVIRINEEIKGIIKVNYLSLRYSPKYDSKKLSYYGLFESWRDTQFIFTLNFNKNLFIWDYINVEKSNRGKRLGTKSVLSIERIARKLGFTRFSVEYPNRAYWIKKLRYNIPYKYRIGSGKHEYTLEGYKEII
ncbi:MAG: hypothetical protein ACMXYL_00965 [Candidatus Woesearchaeota archaeon]